MDDIVVVVVVVDLVAEKQGASIRAAKLCFLDEESKIMSSPRCSQKQQFLAAVNLNGSHS